ncbi:DHA1 family L-arabinose/isopropyl-beta-D-thiogalactopyranoside export protein-like MFS transporter [Orbus hercynius]|uniref:DHA1 family L-arabinose/isopropyl-beta-D-thiogalactopyranoside export protein-like MFS transporter n=1 Tax=Orbus hercynius TaxID=593135 RepID=A0A495RAA7_9GAMM|nr:sugar transporter [Orbus hercynius]RKS84427.1 DHA1 family L-arabinose/isopropyl-beta-D-thiogalactopyranoside export protein-like MFS transporter [Orbus hercynius]
MFNIKISSRNHAWISVISLGFAAFIFNTTEFVPIALLSDISHSFDMNKQDSGIMVTVYAWVVAALSLPLILLLGNTERKRLLTIVFILFIIGHIICYFAISFNWLLFGRIIVASAHAIFWSITSALAIRVAPYGKKSQALAIIATGTSLATILGIPIGRIIGEWLGWRSTFLMIGVMALLVLLILIKVLPKLPSINTGSAKNLPIIMKRPALVGIFIIAAIAVSGSFTAYTFIEQFSIDLVGMTANELTVLLLFFGISGIAGSVIFGKINTKHPLSLLPVSIALLTVALLVLYTSITSLPLFFTVCFFWGIAFTCMMLTQQIKVLDLASDATDIAMAIYSGIVNVGIGAGALIGHQVINYTQIEWIGYFGGAIVFMALCITFFITLRYKALFIERAKANTGTEIITH